MVKSRAALYLSFVTAMLATAGSLYASEIAHLPACVLCWYQRITMYPLVTIIAVGILKRDRLLPLYVLPLSIVGTVIASYHYMLQRGVISNFAPCSLGISCTTKYVEWFGFVTIPFLSLLSFVVITASMIYLLKRKEK